MPVTPGICLMFASGIGSSGPNQRKVMCIDGLSERCAFESGIVARASVAYDEMIDGARAVFRARPQDGRREGGLVRGVREVLRLEGETGTVAVRHTAFPHDRAVEEIPRVEL